MSGEVATVLPQGTGYGVGMYGILWNFLNLSIRLILFTVFGIGLFFSVFMLGIITWLQTRYTPFSPSKSKEFTASRNVKPGLIASGTVSAWTWAVTILQSSAVAYKFGISGPWWDAGGATVQVLLFAQLAVKLKLNGPNAHTFLEIIGARWGNLAHEIFLFFALATNIIISSMLVLGGSATVTESTGMHTNLKTEYGIKNATPGTLATLFVV